MKRKFLSLLLCLSLAVAFAAPGYALGETNTGNAGKVLTRIQSATGTQFTLAPTQGESDAAFVLHAKDAQKGQADVQGLVASLQEDAALSASTLCDGSHHHGSQTKVIETEYVDQYGDTWIHRVTVCAWCGSRV